MARFLRGLARRSATDRHGPAWPGLLRALFAARRLAARDGQGRHRGRARRRAGRSERRSSRPHERGMVAHACSPPRTRNARRRLILYQAAANFLWSEETPWEWTEERFPGGRADIRLGHASQMPRARISATRPRWPMTDAYVEWWHPYFLLSVAPGAGCVACAEVHETRTFAPILSVDPRARRSSCFAPADPDDRVDDRSARLLAERIPGARARGAPGADAVALGGRFERAGAAAIDGFLAEVAREDGRSSSGCSRPCSSPTSSARPSRPRRSATARWRELVERHHACVRALLARFRGTEIDTAGDGFLATFDGPGACDPLRAGDRRGGSAARDRGPGRAPHGRVRD